MSAGLGAEEAARRAHVKLERLQSWEAGEARPTINQLRNLARVYRRPLSVFYLPEVPTSFTPLRDFRRFPGKLAAAGFPELTQEIRRARDRREIALELYQALGEAPPEFAISAGLGEDCEVAAQRLRASLGVTYEEQIRWQSPYEALKRWRATLEDLGILVFQTVGVEPSEARAFSISEFPLPVIAVNNKEAPVARIFSMIHEFAHIALKQGGVCDLEEKAKGRGAEEERVEVACNRIAGAILVPADRLLAETAISNAGARTDWEEEQIGFLAHRYSVSREAILRRLLLVGRTSLEFYRKKRGEYQEQQPRRTGGIVLPHTVAVSSAGPLFVRLVLTSYYQDKITASDLSDMLNVRLKHVPRIERLVLGSASRAGAPA